MFCSVLINLEFGLYKSINRHLDQLLLIIFRENPPDIFQDQVRRTLSWEMCSSIMTLEVRQVREWLNPFSRL